MDNTEVMSLKIFSRITKNKNNWTSLQFRGVNLVSGRQPQILTVVDLDICNGSADRNTVGIADGTTGHIV